MNSKFKIAKNYYQKGKLEKAKNICLEIIKVKPNHLESLRLLSLVFFVNDNYSQSANYIKKAINSGPIVVPNEFIPPARFNLFGPVAGSPKEITKGLAAVC